MKYTIEVRTAHCTISKQIVNSGKKATKVAKKEANENPNARVFISFDGKNGQIGYLNSDGNHGIIGKAW